jgi:formylglycine-generating enzyme required for sulfatase activity
VIEQSVATLAEFQRDFRRSTLVDDETKFRVTFLGQVQADLGFVQRYIMPRLLEVPGMPGVRMLLTEVPQGVYRRVMQANPSRNQGDELPVESVSYDEALEFCRRAGWILGRTVRLPSREETLFAIGKYDPDTLADGFAWLGENSDQRTQAVGTSKILPGGFHDLLGNVAEWSGTPDAAAASALVIGGSYVDRSAAFREVPVVTRPRLDRSRVVGFRVVVEADDEPASHAPAASP